MRAREYEQLDEDWRKMAGAAALATGIGLGGLAYKHLGNKPTAQPTASQQAPEQAKPDMRAMSGSEIQQFMRDQAQRINWKPNEFQQFMAQVMHETQNFSAMAENLYYTTPQRIYKTFTSSFRRNPAEIKNYIKNPQALANRVYANRMGNGNEASGDGWRYRGRGLLHITGKQMYQRVGQGIGVDLVSNPDLIAIDPEVSFQAALWYWKNIVVPKVGRQFQDTKSVTKAINPAMAGLKSRKEKFQQQSNQP
jgi:putative chitinase